MSWNINKPGDYINGPLTVTGAATIGGDLILNGNENYVNLFSTYSVGSNSRVRFRAVGAGGGSGYGGDFRLSTRAENNTWNDTAFVVDSAGKIGVGTIPAHSFHLRSANSPIAMIHSTSASGPYVIFQNSTGNFGDIGSELAITGGGSAGNMALNARTTGSLAFCISDSVKARLLLGGAFVLSGGNSSANGTGIAFPSAQSASTDANTLDDYEEGTWTPVVTSGTGTLTTVGNQLGYYTKIGRVVTVYCFFVITANGTGGSYLIVSGLPFSNNGAVPVIGTGRTDGTTGALVQGKLNSSASALNVWKYDNTYPAADGAIFPISITYFI